MTYGHAFYKHGGVLIEKLRVIHDRTPRGAAVNMAFDEVLLERIAAPTLRLYYWESEAVSFGYFIRHTAVAALANGRELVRRMTGGGIVEHGTDLTYSLLFPAGHALAECPPRESYRAVHAAIAQWMEARGLLANLAPPPTGTGDVCFEKAAEFDLVAADRKIAGAAQRRTRLGLLHQGSIHCDCERAEFPRAFTATWQEEPAEPALVQLAEDLAARKYALQSWTERV